jgi:hypothetical protein
MIGRIVTKISRYEIEGWLHIPLSACAENTRRPKETQWHETNPTTTTQQHMVLPGVVQTCTATEGRGPSIVRPPKPPPGAARGCRTVTARPHGRRGCVHGVHGIGRFRACSPARAGRAPNPPIGHERTQLVAQSRPPRGTGACGAAAAAAAAAAGARGAAHERAS